MVKKTIKKIIEEILEEDEKARNDDNWLVVQVLRRLGIKIYVEYEGFENLPKFESIIRTRAKIQNEEKKFLPTDEEAEKRRSAYIEEEEGITYEPKVEVGQ